MKTTLAAFVCLALWGSGVLRAQTLAEGTDLNTAGAGSVYGLGGEFTLPATTTLTSISFYGFDYQSVTSYDFQVFIGSSEFTLSNLTAVSSGISLPQGTPSLITGDLTLVSGSNQFSAGANSLSLENVTAYNAFNNGYDVVFEFPEYNNSQNGTIAQFSVPEPSSWTLLLAGVGGWLAFQQLRRKTPHSERA